MVSFAHSGAASAARSWIFRSFSDTRVRSKWLLWRSDLRYLSALLTLLLSRPVPLWCSGVLLSDIGLVFSLLLLESLSLMMSYWRQKRAITAAGSDARDGYSVTRRQLSLTHLSAFRLKGWIMEACSQRWLGGLLAASWKLRYSLSLSSILCSARCSLNEGGWLNIQELCRDGVVILAQRLIRRKWNSPEWSAALLYVARLVFSRLCSSASEPSCPCFHHYDLTSCSGLGGGGKPRFWQPCWYATFHFLWGGRC